MPHWLQKVVDILNADTSNLRELARLAGGDPKTFYRGANLEGVDVENQNLQGMEFTDPNLSNRSKNVRGVADEPVSNGLEITRIPIGKILLDYLFARRHGSISKRRVEPQTEVIKLKPHEFDELADRIFRILKIVQPRFRNQRIYDEFLNRKAPARATKLYRRLSTLQKRLIPNLAAYIDSHGRLEERLAVLFDVLLTAPVLGPPLMKALGRRRSKFEQEAFPRIRGTLAKFELYDIHYRDAVLHCITYVISNCYPLSKGVMLLYLAKHLSKHVDANRIINLKLLQSNSVFVTPYEKRIAGYLRSSDESFSLYFLD
jgi:hypothetical protein